MIEFLAGGEKKDNKIPTSENKPSLVKQELCPSPIELAVKVPQTAMGLTSITMLSTLISSKTVHAKLFIAPFKH